MYGCAAQKPLSPSPPVQMQQEAAILPEQVVRSRSEHGRRMSKSHRRRKGPARHVGHRRNKIGGVQGGTRYSKFTKSTNIE